jgi:GT2 family glycosyltransferase
MFYVDIVSRRSLFRASEPFWDIDEASGAGMLVVREAAEALKARRGYLFDPKFFFYAEDQDFCLQVKRLGQRLVLARNAVVHHRISGGGLAGPLACYYSCRNRLFLANEFLPLGYRILFHAFYPASRLARALAAIIKGNYRLASAHVIGLYDGYRRKTGRKASSL